VLNNNIIFIIAAVDIRYYRTMTMRICYRKIMNGFAFLVTSTFMDTSLVSMLSLSRTNCR